MKSFDSVYGTARTMAINEHKETVLKEKGKIVAAIKKEFCVNDFSTLDESEKDSYRAMINEMWNEKEGITEKGREFLNESVAPLTEKSTDDQIKRYIKRQLAPIADKVISDLISGKEPLPVVDIKKQIDEQTGKKYPKGPYKQQVYTILAEFIGKALKAVKL